MRALSLFDGMSCGQIALKKIEITPEVYYASEIDKFAIKQTQLNFPNTIQVGDQNMYDKHKDDPGWVRIDGESWVLKPMVENVPRGWNSLGCGGRKMYINIEGKGIVTSNNCWCQGDVSDAFKDLMPDNATWATKEEFDKAPVVGYIIEGIGLVFTDRIGHEVNA